jgi:hypothetical protein
MNDLFVVEQSAAIARRLIEACREPKARAELAIELAWGRPPESGESERALDFIRAADQALRSTASPVQSRELEAWSSLAKILLTANDFLYVD